MTDSTPTASAQALSLQPVWSASALAAATHGSWHGLSPATAADFSVTRIISNTRQLQAQDAFLALIGERFDAHDFVADAVKQGARAVIVSRLLPDISVPQLLVDDTRLALGRLGAARRAEFPALTTVALTGSSGKTTTKEMLGSILRAQTSAEQVLVTRGNLNNDLGVPMMLLELNPQHRYAVMELGANHVGEIAYTTAMVQPRVAGVLNIGTAHVGEFGGREGIARAKSEIFQGLPTDGIAIIPASGDFHEVIAAAATPFKAIRFGGDAQNSDVYATEISLQPAASEFTLHHGAEQIGVTLPFAGAHNVENALAAAAFALALGIALPTIAAGLGQAPGTKGRLNFIRHALPDAQLILIDDTYNANPHSMRAAAQVLVAQAGARALVLGDIGELGESAAEEHRLLGLDLAQLPVDAIFAVGQYAAALAPERAYADKDALLAALSDWLHSQRQAAAGAPINILFKGSRFMQMESLIAGLEATIAADLALNHPTALSVAETH